MLVGVDWRGMGLRKAYRAEVAIVGGGVSGLWLLEALRGAGLEALLFEREALGAGQTLASQGMIHGGVKYALGGMATAASETLAAMPARWRACLAGAGQPDLRGVRVASHDYHLFSDASLGSRLAGFFASKLLQGRIARLARDDYPAPLRHPAFMGAVYRLEDLVLDVASLLAHFGRRHRDAIIMERVGIDKGRLVTASGATVQAQRIALAAGAGNAALAAQAGLGVRMQRRPLHQALVAGLLPEFYAHAVSATGGDTPRVTITSHRQGEGMVWYLGGGLAEAGAALGEAEQQQAARQLLGELLPWLDFGGCRFASLRIDRAEPQQGHGRNPGAPFVWADRDFIVCWPMKLTLAPALGDAVLATLGIAAGDGVRQRERGTAGKSPPVAPPPWAERETAA